MNEILIFAFINDFSNENDALAKFSPIPQKIFYFSSFLKFWSVGFEKKDIMTYSI